MRLLSEDQFGVAEVRERAKHPDARQPSTEARHGSAFREPAVSEREQGALQLWVKLSRAHNAIAAHAAADIARHGMTLAEFGILEALYHRGPLLLGEVQRRILVSSGGITFLVDRLTAKGLVERRQCPGDKRARYAELTAKGERFVAEAFPAHARALAHAVEALDDEELASVSSLLRQVGMGAAAQSIGEASGPALVMISSDQDCEGA
jgi:MarR family 2-MHQ and catechol resistance regulon transcriptional repressor